MPTAADIATIVAVHPIAEQKSQWRTRLLAARRARPANELAAARAAIAATVRERVRAAGYSCVAAYLPMRTEPGSLELLGGLRTDGVRVLVPLLLPDRDLDWAEHPGTEPLGTDAIGTAQLVLVPALAVARDGTRLGRGGGSYDRALARLAPGAVVAALVFDDEVVEALPAQEWDVAVRSAVTPSGWVELGGAG